jgi:carbonic anhydrase
MNSGKEIRFNVLSMAIVAAGLSFGGLASAADTEFSYSGDSGPGFWSELSSDWGACAGTASNARQSPVAIDHARFDRHLRPLALQSFPTTVDIFNNGHTIEQNYEGTRSSILFEGRHFELQQFHFHSLSEHAVRGERGAMELHAVFAEPASADKLVVGVIFEIGKTPNPFVQVLIDAGLPRKNGDTTVTATPINLADVLPDTSSYFTYAGSLTTPPCTENVTWIVLANTAKVSQPQFQSFQRILGDDFRPLQKLNGRVVRFTSASPHHGDDKD